MGGLGGVQLAERLSAVERSCITRIRIPLFIWKFYVSESR